jgi:hypothetical protein
MADIPARFAIATLVKPMRGLSSTANLSTAALSVPAFEHTCWTLRRRTLWGAFGTRARLVGAAPDPSIWRARPGRMAPVSRTRIEARAGRPARIGAQDDNRGELAVSVRIAECGGDSHSTDLVWGSGIWRLCLWCDE